MKNKTLTKNMPNVKWNAIPPVRGPNPQGRLNGNNKNSRKKNTRSVLLAKRNDYSDSRVDSFGNSSYSNFISSGVILIISL